MGITMSPQEYATAFRILGTTARHPDNLAALVEQRLLPGMRAEPTLLDVGAGSGLVAARLAPHFTSLTLLEPNRHQTAGFEHDKAQVVEASLEDFGSSQQYDLVVCCHVLYHVPLQDWAAFIGKLMSLVRPGGHCLIVMTARSGPSYELCRAFQDVATTSEEVVATVQQMQLPHEVIPTPAGFSTRTLEEMVTLCRFFVLEGSYTPQELAAMSPDEVRRIDEEVRVHAERCRGDDGVYRLGQDEDVVLIRRPQVA